MITSRFPHPPLKGDKIRAYYPIKLLSRNHEIDLISFSEEKVHPLNIAAMKEYCRHVVLVPINNILFQILQLAAIFSPMPSQVFCYSSSAMLRRIHGFLTRHEYDLIHVICGRLALYRRSFSRLPAIIDWIDSFSLSTLRLYETETSLIKKIALYKEWQKMTNYEQRYVDSFDSCYITSHFDKNHIGRDFIQVIPNGVDLDVFRPLPVKKDFDLIFTGNMGYLPNISTVKFFCEEVLPLVIARRPRTTFYVVGANPDSRVLKYHDGRNVVVTGYVESIAEQLNSSRIFVAPLRSGAGIQNKILEGMACSLPVIGTSRANAAIQAKNDVQILVRDDPASFAAAILDLLASEKKQAYLGRNGFDLVRTAFTWQSVADNIERLYSRLVPKRRTDY